VSEPIEATPVDRRLLLKTAVGLLLVLLVAAVCAWLLKEPIESVGAAFLERFGLGGVFVGTVITDTSPLPLTHEPLVMLGLAAGVEWPVLLLTVSTASVLSGPVGWTLGRFLVADSRFTGWLQSRQPDFFGLMQRHGIQAVAVAALLPLPFALATWSAGMLRLPLGKVAAVSLLRVPKVAFYLLLMNAGWIAGGG